MEDHGQGSRRGRRRVPALRPVLEDLEARKLVSVMPVVVGPKQSAASSPIRAAAGAGGSSGGSSNFGAGFSPLFGTGQPTPHEQARQRFHAFFQGPVTVGPGRFSDQSKVIYFR